MTKNAKIAIISGIAALVLISGLVLVQQMSQKKADDNANVPVATNQPATNEPPAGEPVNPPVPPPPQATTKGNADIIRVTSPRQGDVVTSPLEVTGEARGNWYFEATFPIKLVDRNGKVIAQHYAQAEGDWMTSEYVPFRGTLTFDQPETATGQLILEKSNASGLPEHDDSYVLAVRFSEPPAKAQGECRKTGCSGQLCASEDLVTTCEYRDEYSCYQTATCEMQPTGLCGWTPSPQLLSCLAGKQ